MSDSEIFRKVALDRLSSPEQLDELMEVTTSKAWMALATMGLLSLLLLVWSFTGSLPTKIHATGILLKEGGVADISATTGGQVTEITVREGDRVEVGDVVAQLAQPAKAEEVAASEARLAELRLEYDRLSALGSQGQELRGEEQAQQRNSLWAEFRTALDRKKYLEKRLASQQDLYDKGLITSQALESTRSEVQGAQSQIGSINSRLTGLRVDELGAKKRGESELKNSELQIKEGERRLSYLKQQLELSTQVVSRHAGRVLEQRAGKGDIIGSGTALLSIELEGEKAEPLEVLLYIPSSQGKQVKPGMELQIAPSVVRREEHGVVLGQVRSVAEFPSTRQGMMRELDNPELVQSFLNQTEGTPIAVRAVLKEASGSPSGYEWSSGAGPDIQLSTGTPCTASITTKTQKPITLLLPALRTLFGA
jgi:HlyD family secretion protein